MCDFWRLCAAPPPCADRVCVPAGARQIDAQALVTEAATGTSGDPAAEDCSARRVFKSIEVGSRPTRARAINDPIASEHFRSPQRTVVGPLGTSGATAPATRPRPVATLVNYVSARPGCQQLRTGSRMAHAGV